jgi:hypothetical protein
MGKKRRFDEDEDDLDPYQPSPDGRSGIPPWEDLYSKKNRKERSNKKMRRRSNRPTRKLDDAGTTDS